MAECHDLHTQIPIRNESPQPSTILVRPIRPAEQSPRRCRGRNAHVLDITGIDDDQVARYAAPLTRPAADGDRRRAAVDQGGAKPARVVPLCAISVRTPAYELHDGVGRVAGAGAGGARVAGHTVRCGGDGG